jgi:predicted RNA binding protein YcfA (HicA-like mRNA interferase family)
VTRLPRLTGADLIAALATAGFAVILVRGSHHFLRHPDGRSTVVPAHGAFGTTAPATGFVTSVCCIAEYSPSGTCWQASTSPRVATGCEVCCYGTIKVNSFDTVLVPHKFFDLIRI